MSGNTAKGRDQAVPVDDCEEIPLGRLRDALVTGQMRSAALVKRCLERMARRNDGLRCVIEVQASHARKAAVLADEATTPLGALHGIPFAIKDMFGWHGRRPTGGARQALDHHPAGTAEAVARLEAAGAILIGMLNLDELAAAGTGDNPHHGRMPNPWAPDRIVGGSSGGSASAVAAGLVPFALGSDTGGSIRLPAALCGVTGFKPTAGLVPAGGSMARSPTMDSIGPIAPAADDCTAVLAVLADRPGLIDEVASFRLAALRVGRVPTGEGPALGAGVEASLSAAWDVLAALGCILRPASSPDLAEMTTLHQTIVQHEAAILNRDALAAGTDRISADLAARLRSGTTISAERYAAARERCAEMRRRSAEWFGDLDLIVTPLNPCGAPRFADLEAEGGTALTTAQSHWLRFVNLLGLPALAVPIGADAAGLPVAMQIIGRAGADALVLGLGAAFQAATDWHRRRPPIPE